MTRRRFLVGSGAVVAGAAVASTAGVLISGATSPKHSPANASPSATATPSTTSKAPAIPAYTGLRTRP
ncbi:MAG TPA: hypothetical protein VJQ83_00805, partial [Tepidiformaceae bacterium]|nr:hypothetical protein [Tepidiformaceae bacterium]